MNGIYESEQASSMIRVTLNELSRVPVERLAQLLMEWAAEDRTLLNRLEATISQATVAPPPDPAVKTAAESSKEPRSELVGQSAAIRHVADLLIRFAQTEEPVLITGESGTGKELAAQAIHENSSRSHGRFVAVNCAAIPSNLVASELFGYEKGAFTGAAMRTKGQIEHANGGTLFLDEIGDMPVDMQGHLLRFLQEGQIVRVGGRETIHVNARVVSATNVRLDQAIADGRFREDLYYRLNVLTVPLPTLRERRDDIELLAHYFLRQITAAHGTFTGFTAEAMQMLCRHDWPGNVRELMSVIRRAVVIGNGPLVAHSDLLGLGDAPRGRGAASPTPAPRPPPCSEAEKLALLRVLAETDENITLTAQALGVSRVTLYRMLHRHAITLNRGLKTPPKVG
ncbi:MAG TPA: sigma-54 dependent transcriptional regulator [Acetobacteraceae bacterium]|jgi:transcriptional regulator with PAS, ATPase and Fis domain